MKSLPRNWDVDPPAAKESAPRVPELTMEQVRSHIFCLKVGDRAIFAYPVSQRRFSQIVRRAKEAWPGLSNRQFELTREGTYVRRTK
jgi:hypothetical protein